MRKTLLALGTALAVTLAVGADENPPDTYQKAMLETGDAMQAIRAAAKEIEESGAGAQDYDPFVTAAATMRSTFATTLAYWQTKKIDDAIQFAQEAAKQADALTAAAKERDYRLALASISALGATCTGCHSAHRARLTDGSFAIK
jgi:hypothetical protein